MNQFDIQTTEEEQQKFTSSYTRLDKQPSISQLSSVYHSKIELFQKFMQCLIGSYIFTYGIIASNDNVLAVLMIYFFTIFMSSKINVLNPAVAMMECLQGLISTTDLWVSMLGQFIGSMLGAFTGYEIAHMISNDWVTKLPYLNASISNGIIAQLYGEVFGSAVLLCVILIQDDDYLRFTDDHLEHGLLVTAAFGAARQLSYKCDSVFNPFIAFSLELFECIYTSSWSRFGFVWIFMIGPYIGAMIALIFVNQAYKNVYNQKIRNGI